MEESETLKKALLAIRKLKKMLEDKPMLDTQPIAIVGLSCRVPMANHKNEFWNLLTSGTCVIGDYPDNRWEKIKFVERNLSKDDIKQCKGGYLSAIDVFDAQFFGITPREAQRLDPQQRLLLEVSYEALEDAGISLEQLAGSNTGVFTSLYGSQLTHFHELEDDLDALYIPSGNAVSMAANRLSYLFDLHGPSLVVDTACSSSLIGLQLACLHIHTNLCHTALVNAVNLNILPSINHLLLKAKMLSPNGQCKTFDEAANGYVQGEGVCAVVLKPLDKALADNDRIYALIAGIGVNQDGKTNGLTAPNGLQQEILIRSVCEKSGIKPQQISYVDCHGTGTFLGDPIEVQALGEAIGKNRSRDNPCWINSLKTNIGHLEPAAGLASIIKMSLALYHKKILPHANFTTPNPHIQFDRYHFCVPQTVMDWPNMTYPRFASVSSFGFGGTNAHCILQEYQDTTEKNLTNDDVSHIFTISAKDKTTLQEIIKNWITFLKKNALLSLTQLCYNTQLRRSHYFCRIAIITRSIAELIEVLERIQILSWDNVSAIENVFVNLDKEMRTFPHENNRNPTSEMAKNYVNRQAVDWKKIYLDKKYMTLDLPAYPWQHAIEYWPKLKIMSHPSIAYPFRRLKLFSPVIENQFEFEFSTKVMPEIHDSFNFLHAGYYLEMLGYATAVIHNAKTFVAEDIHFTSPIYIPDGTSVKVQLIFEYINNEKYLFTFYSSTESHTWVKHATGYILFTNKSSHALSKGELIKKCDFSSGNAEEFAQRVLSMGMPLGDSIRWTSQYWKNNNEIFCEFREPKTAAKRDAFSLMIHPGIIDGCIQSLFMLLPEHLIKPFIASHIKKIHFYGIKNYSMCLYAELINIRENDGQYDGNFYLIDHEGNIIFECEGLTMSQLNENVTLSDNNIKIDLSSLTLEEKRASVMAFLLKKASHLFAMLPTDIDIHKPLREIGIDSLMAISFSADIESTFAVTYPMQSILSGPSLTEMMTFMLNDQSAESMTTHTNVWLMRQAKNPSPPYKLFCFPYGGSGASVFADWHHHLPDVEICALQLPGRENRLSEPLIDNIQEIVANLLDQIKEILHSPFAFFGHSFGALLAFELTRALRRKHLPLPQHLFVSAFPDPRMPTKSLDRILSQLRKYHIDLFDLANSSVLSDETLEKVTHVFSDNGLDEIASVFLKKEMLKIVLPIFIADMHIVKSYDYFDAGPLDIAMTVLSGNEDAWVTLEDQLGWAGHTKKACYFNRYEGNHLFIRDEKVKRAVLEYISRTWVTANVSNDVPSELCTKDI